jgi:prepilin-type N-terminal cleavage/methylation domain
MHYHTKVHSKADRGDDEKLTQAYVLVRRGVCRGDNKDMQMKATWYQYPKYLPRFSYNQGLSLIEIMVSLLIVSIGLVGFGMAIPMQKDTIEAMKEERIALLLAKQIMEEIQSKAYEDPDQTPVLFGFEPGENAPRINFDDIDDYDDWNKNPPQYPDGTILNGENETPDYQNFRRQVVVENVDNSDYSLIRDDGDTASKRVTITVSSTTVPEPFKPIVIRWVANREGMELLY